MNMKRMRRLPLLIFLLLIVMSVSVVGMAEASEAVQELTVPNTPIKGMIRIDKRGPVLVGFDAHEDANGLMVHTPLYDEGALEGAVFELRAVEDMTGKDDTNWFTAGELADTVTTTANAAAQSRLLPLGHYRVTEVSAPAGYAVDNTHFDVVLAAKDQHTPAVSVTICAANRLVPVRMTLHKEKEVISTVADEKGIVHSTIASEPGAGCVFGLYNSSGISYPNGFLPVDSLIATAVSGEDGTLTFEGFFPHGSYYVRELSTPAGWLVDDTLLPVQISDAYRTGNHEIAIEVEAPVRNEIVHADVRIAKTDLTGSDDLPNTLIEVKNSVGEIVCRDYTGEDGYLPAFPAVPGIYTFREVLAPEGYALCATELAFTVHEDGTVTGLTAVADDFTRVSVKKVNQQHEPLEGVVFGLFREDGSLQASAVSDAAGIVTFEQIPYGTYFIQEAKTMSGYVKDFTRIPITVDGSFVNPEEPLAELVNCPTEILLRKVDQNDTALPGAVFGLYDEDGTLVMTATSDAEGLVRFVGAAVGKYTIRELDAPDGYLTSKDVIHVTIDEGYTNNDVPLATVVNQEKKVLCIKVDTSGTPMPGIPFSLYHADTMEKVETAVSDKDGVFCFTRFDYGDWLIREDAAPEGYCPMEDIRIHVGSDWKTPAPLMCVNIPNHYEFIKVDSSGMPLAGVKFRLEDANRQEVSTFVSGKDGIVHVTGLQRGTYTIREIETLEGYSVTGEVIQLKVDEAFTIPQQMRKLVNYRMNEGSWIDCENQFADGKAGITVRENGTITLRITDPHGYMFEECAQVSCIDLTAPALTAAINGTTLQIEARDDLSGVAGVQVNSMLFTTMTGGVLNVPLDETMNRFEKLAVRAFDYAGNFTEPVSLDNPCYVKPTDPTPTPTATPKATKKPVDATPVATQMATVTPNPYQGLGSSLIYVYDEPDPTAVPTTAPTPEPIIQTEYITIGPGMPYQADGNSHTLDVLYSAATNKQFITLQSKNGNTFYLVIDYDKPIDEEAEMYETYFLNLVDERDLLALLSEDEREEVPTPTPEIIYVTPVPTTVPAVTATPAPTEPEAPLMSEQMKAMLALAAIAGFAVVGILVFLKGKRDGVRARADNDFELEDDEDEQNEA